MSNDRTFMGMPISGEINNSHKGRVEQRPTEELMELMKDVLNDPKIVRIGWTQYTPYFMDGDVCEFGVNEPWYVTTEEKTNLGKSYDDADYDSSLEDDDEPGYRYRLDSHPTLGGKVWDDTFQQPDRNYRGGYRPVESKFPETTEKCEKFDKAFNSGAFEEALLDAFGDHATVIATKDGFTVEFYEHD